MTNPPPRSDLPGVAESDAGMLGKLLAALPCGVRDTLLSDMKFRDVPKGTVIFERGEVSTEVGYVISGTLAMIQVIDPVRKHIVGLLVPTDIYGRLFDGPSNYRLEALAPTRLVSFPRATFERVLRQHPEAERLFLVHLLDEMDAAREWLLLMGGRTVVNRVAAFLSILMRRERSSSCSGPLKLRLPLARKDLAHYLGARPESLSRAFHELEDRGTIRIIDPNVFEVIDPEALIESSGDDLVI